jgi:CRP/FNR family transcriptional regulator, dissimilatory nitrate respiration regulator
MFCHPRNTGVSDMDAKDWLPAKIQSSGIERRLVAGQMLFDQGDAAVGVYEVVSGKVRQLRVDPEGRDVVVGIAGPGEMIAEASLFSRTHDCAARAVTNAVVRLYRKATLLAQLERDPQAALSFMATLVEKILNLRIRLERRSIPSARDRVRHYLTTNVGGRERTVALPSTLKDLAAELGLTHETLYRTLSEMRAKGEIARLNGKIRLVG